MKLLVGFYGLPQVGKLLFQSIRIKTLSLCFGVFFLLGLEGCRSFDGNLVDEVNHLPEQFNQLAAPRPPGYADFYKMPDPPFQGKLSSSRLGAGDRERIIKNALALKSESRPLGYLSVVQREEREFGAQTVWAPCLIYLSVIGCPIISYKVTVVVEATVYDLKSEPIFTTKEEGSDMEFVAFLYGFEIGNGEHIKQAEAVALRRALGKVRDRLIENQGTIFGKLRPQQQSVLSSFDDSSLSRGQIQ